MLKWDTSSPKDKFETDTIIEPLLIAEIVGGARSGIFATCYL